MAGRYIHIPGNRQPPRQQPQATHIKLHPPPPPAHLIAAHQREVHQLLVDQKEMLSIHSVLKQDISSLDQEILSLSATSREFTLKSDAKINDLYNESVKLEAQVRAIDDLNFEHAQVVGDIRKLTESNALLSDKLKGLNDELGRVKSDASHVILLLSDVDNMKQEILKGRAAVEFEKKTRLANLEMSEAMEKKKSSMQYEIEMLRAELSNAEKRARAAAAAASNPNPGYMGNYGSRSMVYGGAPYSVQYSMHQGQLTADVPSPALYGRPGGIHGPLDNQQHHMPKG